MAFWIGLIAVILLYFGTGAICVWQGFDKALKVAEDCYWSVLGLWYIIYGLFFTETILSLRLYVLSGCGFFFISVILLAKHWIKLWKAKVRLEQKTEFDLDGV